jgi:hypothetical protein
LAMDSPKDTADAVGCPIRRSRDQRVLAPPPSFSQRATSFIASRCQGIHQMPFSSQARPRPAHNPRLRAEEQNASFAEASAPASAYPAPDARVRAAPTRRSPRPFSRARVCFTVTSRCTMSNFFQKRADLTPSETLRSAQLHRADGDWWAWADLNGRPHAYQACALTS